MPLTPKVSGNRSPDEIREACENFPGFIRVTRSVQPKNFDSPLTEAG
jgi:hypothetical protein